MSVATHDITCLNVLLQEYSSQVSKRLEKSFLSYHEDELDRQVEGQTDKRAHFRVFKWFHQNEQNIGWSCSLYLCGKFVRFKHVKQVGML